MKGTENAAAPLVVRSDEGEARWMLGSLAVVKVTSADSGGAMTVVEVAEPAGEVTPPVVDHAHDNLFSIVDGAITFDVEGRTFEAAAGDHVFVPRGARRGWTVGEDGGRYVLAVLPGGFEDLIRALSEPAAERTLPPALEEPPDLERLRALAAEHGIERVG